MRTADSRKKAGQEACWRHKIAFLFFSFFALMFILGLFNCIPLNVMRYLLQIFLYTALGEAWNLLSGYADMTSLGQQLYVGITGYAIAVTSSTYHGSFWLGLIIGLLAAEAAALLLSRVLFRMRGMFFSIATWIATEAAEKIFLNWKFVGQGSGMTIHLKPYPGIKQIYLLSLAVCFVSVLSVYILLRTRRGLALLAIRDDSTAAETVGINLDRSCLVVYLIAALLSALAGGIFFLNKGTIYPDSGFSISWTISAVFICVIGGTGTIAGPASGALIYVILREYLAHYPGWSNIMLGLICLLVIFFLPDGIIGTIVKKHRLNWASRDVYLETESA